VQFEVLADSDTVARAAADRIAAAAREAVTARGRFVIAVSGGHTPWQMLRDLAGEGLSWTKLHFVQVDERVAPSGDPDRNLTHLRESLSGQSRLPAGNIHPMPVEALDLAKACLDYTGVLQSLAGRPPVLDLVHLGLGPDGHTASLVPGDPVLNIIDAAVALTGVYQGRRRMTLTYPMLNRARRILWVVTGMEKRAALKRLRSGDPSIPGGRINADHASILADRDAAGSSL
jgi:6-phosphogluconolactonase